MQNYDFSLRATVKVLKPKRDENDKAVLDKDTGLVVKELVDAPGLVRGRVVFVEDALVIVNEQGAEVGRVVVTDGQLDLQEGEADPDKRIRMGIAGGIPEDRADEIPVPPAISPAPTPASGTVPEPTPASVPPLQH